MKKIIALILLICISFMLFSIPSAAEGEVFVAVGNTVLPLTDAMPMRSGGLWYVDYQCFTKGDLNVSSSYNAGNGTLVLYTWDTTLIFDLNTTTAYTSEEKVPYKAIAVAAAGTVYVPIQFTAQMLNFDYTYLPSLPMLRIKRSSDIPDDIFSYIAESEIPDILEAYNKNKQTSKPQTQTTQSKPVQNTNDEQKKSINLTFNITDGKNMKLILDRLSRYGYKATFFIQGSAIQNCENELRRAVASGHSLGILSENGAADFKADPDTLKQALDNTNNLLFDVTKEKTRLLRVPGGSKTLAEGRADLLISLGYRIWDENVAPTGSSSSRIYNSAVSQLNVRNRTAVITLSDSDLHTSALSKLLTYIKEKKYFVSPIDILDTPVNQISETR